MPWRSDEYWAGFFDGEGNINIGRLDRLGARYVYYKVCVRVHSTDLQIIACIQRDFGGLIYPAKHTQKHKKRSYSWQAVAAKAPSVLRRLIPFLIIKREQAELAFELQTSYRLGGRHVVLTVAEQARRQEIWAKVRQLNKRGNLETEFMETVSIKTGMSTGETHQLVI